MNNQLQTEPQHWPGQLELIYQWLHVFSVSMILSSYRSVHKVVRLKIQMREFGIVSRWLNIWHFRISSRSSVSGTFCIRFPKTHLTSVASLRPESHTASLTCKVQKWVYCNHRREQTISLNNSDQNDLLPQLDQRPDSQIITSEEF